MKQSTLRFNHRVTAQHYIQLYEKMLQRPLIQPKILGIQEPEKNQLEKKSNGSTLSLLVTPHTQVVGQEQADYQVSSGAI